MFAFAADIHIGNHKYYGGPVSIGVNDRCKVILKTLSTAINYSDFSDFFILGDLFDKANPNPQMVLQTWRAINSEYTNIHILIGNHDQISNEHNDHGACTLPLMGNINVYSNIEDIGDLDYSITMVPFKNGPASEWLLSDLTDYNNHYSPKSEILCMHLGIWDNNTPRYLINSHDAVSIDLIKEIAFKFNYKLIIAGNWHKRQLWKLDHLNSNVTWVVQCGSLCPVSFSDTNVGGEICIWDKKMEEPNFIEIPGPRFLQFNSIDKLKNFLSNQNIGCKNYLYFVRLTVSEKEYQSSLKLRDDFIQNRKLKNVNIEILIDSTEAEQKAIYASKLARKASNINKAINEYINKINIPIPGTREGVKEKLRRFRKDI